MLPMSRGSLPRCFALQRTTPLPDLVAEGGDYGTGENR